MQIKSLKNYLTNSAFGRIRCNFREWTPKQN